MILCGYMSEVLSDFSSATSATFGRPCKSLHGMMLLSMIRFDVSNAILCRRKDEYLSSWEKREFCAVVMADNDSAVLIVDDFFIVKLDAAGIVLWELNLSEYQRTAEAAALVDDGAIVIVGSQDANTFAVKIGANGSAVEWTWEVRESRCDVTFENIRETRGVA